MSLRVVAVNAPAHLRHADRSLIIERGGEEIGRVPIEDMAVLVLDGPELTLSHRLLGACAEANVAVVTAGETHLPNGLLLPLAGHSLHTETLRAQIASSLPNQKRTWQSIVKAKLLAQARLLERWDLDAREIRKLLPFIRSGDPDNIEARAAARYFERLFGPDFLRDREASGENAMLNYGYAVLRAAVARAVVGAGLVPALGVHHRNRYNPLCLADDAIEPFRPLVDHRVKLWLRGREAPEALAPEVKRHLLGILVGGAFVDDLRFPLLVALERFAASLRRSIVDGEPLLVPQPDFAEDS